MSKPLLYLPGIDGTGRLLYAQPRLHRHFHVTAMPYPQDEIHQYDGLLQQAIDNLTSLGEATVLAESFGGAIGMMLALERPTRVSRLVLVNTFAWYPRRAWIGLAALVGRLFPERPPSRLWQPMRSYFTFGPGVPLEIREEWWRRTADVPLAVLGHRLRLIWSLDLRPRLGDISVPTWILAAPNDRIVPAVAGRRLALAVPSARLWQPRVGHAALVHPAVDVEAWLKISTSGRETPPTPWC